MAGIPDSIIVRAWEVLDTLEKGKIIPNPKMTGRPVRLKKADIIQGDLFTLPGEQINPNYKKLHDEIMHMSVNNMTPLEVLNKIYELQQKYASHN
jgi:DNA mismatch repair protein MutS